jgi:hypothetical protein
MAQQDDSCQRLLTVPVVSPIISRLIFAFFNCLIARRVDHVRPLRPDI